MKRNHYKSLRILAAFCGIRFSFGGTEASFFSPFKAKPLKYKQFWVVMVFVWSIGWSIATATDDHHQDPLFCFMWQFHLVAADWWIEHARAYQLILNEKQQVIRCVSQSTCFFSWKKRNTFRWMFCVCECLLAVMNAIIKGDWLRINQTTKTINICECECVCVRSREFIYFISNSIRIEKRKFFRFRFWWCPFLFFSDVSNVFSVV